MNLASKVLSNIVLKAMGDLKKFVTTFMTTSLLTRHTKTKKKDCLKIFMMISMKNMGKTREKL